MAELQEIIEVRNLCNSSAYKFVLDRVRRELLGEVERKMKAAEELIGSLHGEWKALHKILDRLSVIGDEYNEQYEETLRNNPDLLGKIAANRFNDTKSQ